MGGLSQRGQDSARLDMKQVVSTIVGGVFAVGIVFLVGIHVGKQVDAETVVGAAVEAPASAIVVADVSTREVVEQTDYGFFELLDAPAPTRTLAPVELAINPKLEEKRRARSERRARKRKTNDEVALAKASPKAKSAKKRKARKSKKDPKTEVMATGSESTGGSTKSADPQPQRDADESAVARAASSEKATGGSDEGAKAVLAAMTHEPSSASAVATLEDEPPRKEAKRTTT